MTSLPRSLVCMSALLIAACSQSVPEQPIVESNDSADERVDPAVIATDVSPAVQPTSITVKTNEPPKAASNVVSPAAPVPNEPAPTAVKTEPEAPSAEPEMADSVPTNGAAAKTYPPEYYDSPKFRVEGPEGAMRVTFDDLDLLKLMKLEDPEPGFGADLPARITDLDGKRVRFRAFMMPPFAFEGLTGFLAAKDNELCCFGRAAKIYDVFPVELRAGTTTRYIRARPFDVAGTFHVAPDVELEQLYYVTDAVVIE